MAEILTMDKGEERCYQAELAQASAALTRITGKEVSISLERLLADFSTEEAIPAIYKEAYDSEAIRQRLHHENDIVPVSHHHETLQRAVKAFWKWALTGFKLVPPEVYLQRISVCKTCIHYSNDVNGPIYALPKQISPGSMICGVCGCFVGKKASLISENCPLEAPEHPGYSLWHELLSNK